jgi:hypothetical protein
MIPLNIRTLEPHNCAENPYNQQQQQQQQQKQEPELDDVNNISTSRVYFYIIIEKLDVLNSKLDKLLEAQ